MNELQSFTVVSPYFIFDPKFIKVAKIDDEQYWIFLEDQVQNYVYQGIMNVSEEAFQKSTQLLQTESVFQSKFSKLIF